MIVKIEDTKYLKLLQASKNKNPKILHSSKISLFTSSKDTKHMPDNAGFRKINWQYLLNALQQCFSCMPGNGVREMQRITQQMISI